MKHVRLLCALLVGLMVVGCTSDEKKPEPSPVKPVALPEISGEKAVLVSVSATVEKIDIKKREVTLKGPLGNLTTFTVDKRVTRLDEVKVGDEVTASYFISLAGELRPPTEEEKQNPIVVKEGVAKAPKGMDPGAGAVRTVTVVATIEGLDLPSKTMTLKGPMGNSVVVLVDNAVAFKQMHIGDNVVVTYTEALAITLDKVAKR